MRARLLPAYWWFERRIAPGLRYSQSYYEDALDAAVHPGAAWLDVGCGHRLLPPWRVDAERELVARGGTVIGIDVELSALCPHTTLSNRALASVTQLPFRSGSFDLVTANMVAEHLEFPEQQFSEVARVLRPNGIFLLHTPNLNAYTTRLARMVPDWMRQPLIRLLQGRDSADVFPTYYRVNSGSRISEVASAAGLGVVEVRGVLSSAEFAMILPLAIVELLWLRYLMRPSKEALRPTLIALLRKSQRR